MGLERQWGLGTLLCSTVAQAVHLSPCSRLGCAWQWGPLGCEDLSRDVGSGDLARSCFTVHWAPRGGLGCGLSSVAGGLLLRLDHVQRALGSGTSAPPLWPALAGKERAGRVFTNTELVQ